MNAHTQHAYDLSRPRFLKMVGWLLLAAILSAIAGIYGHKIFFAITIISVWVTLISTGIVAWDAYQKWRYHYVPHTREYIRE